MSAGALAHHFDGVKALLTEVALLGYEELAGYLDEAAGLGAPEVRLRRIAPAYITFALHHPRRFRLMFRNDLTHRSDPRYSEVSLCALSSLALAAQGTGAPNLNLSDPESAGRVFTAWSTIHGMAYLLIEDKGGIFSPRRTHGTSSMKFCRKPSKPYGAPCQREAVLRRRHSDPQLDAAPSLVVTRDAPLPSRLV